jgi:pimeloyl-ACP methyl ester carboxylesterase
MDKRLGDVPPAMREWWIQLMGRTPKHVLLGMLRHVGGMDLTGILPRIKAPTLMITSDGSALAPLPTVKRWAGLIPNAELLVLSGNSYNITVSQAEECATAMLEFLRRPI